MVPSRILSNACWTPSLESGDVVLMSKDLSGLLTALYLGRAVMTNIRQNLFWAFAFNTIGIPVAMGLPHLFGGPGKDEQRHQRSF